MPKPNITTLNPKYLPVQDRSPKSHQNGSKITNSKKHTFENSVSEGLRNCKNRHIPNPNVRVYRHFWPPKKHPKTPDPKTHHPKPCQKPCFNQFWSKYTTNTVPAKSCPKPIQTMSYQNIVTYVHRLPNHVQNPFKPYFTKVSIQYSTFMPNIIKYPSKSWHQCQISSLVPK